MHSEFVGTAIYVAPEVLFRSHNFKCDIWSCGVIAYILISGTMPFWDEDEDKLFEQIKKGKFDVNDQYWRRVSALAKDFVKKLMTYEKKDRPTAAIALNDIWLTRNNLPPGQKVISDASIAFENIIQFNQFSKMKQVVYSYLI